MMDTVPHTMVLAVHPAALERLDAFVAQQGVAEERWLASQAEREDLARLRGPQRRAAQARIRAARQQHREAGRHRPTRALALAPALRAELEHRGLLQEWEPVPADTPTAGQTLGGRGPHTGTGLTGRLVVALPDALWTPLVRGTYWTNQPHLQALQAWTDQWGAGGRSTPPQALEERAQHAGRITTTGDVLRAALHRTLHP